MSPTKTYDLAVIGLGAVGSMAAWRAATRGADVIGIEQYGEAHARGSSHGGSRIFRRTLFEGVDYVPLVNRASELWQELGRTQPLFTRSGGLCIGPPDSDVIKKALESARLGGFEHYLLDPGELAHRYPQHATIDDDVAVLEPGAGVLNPERCISAAHTLARKHGADIRLETPVAAIHQDDSGVIVDLGTERIRTRRAIIATGAWFTDLIPELELPLQIVRSPLVWFTGADRPAYRPDRFPVFVRKSRDLDVWGITDVDGAGVKIGAGPSAPKPRLARPEDNSYPIDDRDLGPVEAACRRAFPGLDPVAVAAEPCMNSATPDRNFILGVSRYAPSLVLAGGFSGHGFKHSSASGDICVDLALDGGIDVPLDAFSPDRFSEGR